MPRQRKQRGAGSSALPFKEITAKLTNEELVKRLKGCLNYLEDIDEVEDGTNDELISLSLTILSPSILNKTNEICSLATLILANLYRLFLLDIPHNEKQMKSVFRLFISSFDALKKPSDSSYKLTYSLLEILSAMSLFNFCLKFDDQDVLVELFKKIQEIIIPNQKHQVEQFLLKIMFSVIQEASHLPDQLLDTVLVPLIEPHKSDEPLVHSFTCKLIKKSSQYLEPFLRHFFNGILVNGEESDSAVADSLYELIPQLYSIDNYLLLLILPQLEWKLQSVDIDVRSKVTQLLGPMFSAPGSKLSTENRQLFYSYLGRCQDFSPSIRLEVIKECKSLLLNHPHLRDDVTEKLLPRVVDQDEKVRLEVVKSILDAASEDMTCIDERLLDSLQHRMRDKKWPVRKYTMMSLVKLYKNNLSDDRLKWIPCKLLHSYNQPFPEDKICITRCLNSCIVPSGAEIKEKIDRLLHVYYTNDESANNSLIDILNTQKTIREHLLSMISVTDEENEINDEERKKLVAVKSAAIAGCLPDPLRTQASLRELPSDEVLMRKLADSIDVTNDHQSITKAKTEVYLHVSDNQPLVELLKMLHDISSPVLINRDCTVALSNRIYKEMSNPSLLQSEEEELEEQEKCKKGIQLLKVLSGIEGVWFHDEELLQNVISLLRDKDNETVQNSLIILINIGSIINDTFTSISSVLCPILFQLASKGSPKSAKLAVRCLLSIYPDNTSNFERLYKLLVDGLDLGSVHLESVLKSLSVLAENRHRVFEKHRNDVLVRFAVKKILEPEVDEDETEEEESECLNLWCPDSNLSVDTRLRIASMKLLVCWIVGFPSERLTDRQKSIVPIIRLLVRTIEDKGDPLRTGRVSPPERSRLRLVAGLQLLKLASLPEIHETIQVNDFLTMGLLAQDSCDEVRDVFMNRVTLRMKKYSLSLRYASFYSLAVINETRKQNKAILRQMFTDIIELRRKLFKLPHSNYSVSILPEYSLPFVIYLLAHNPSFSRINHKSLLTFKDCLLFYIEPLISKADNYLFLAKMFELIKQYVDAQSPDDLEINKNIYAVCDLASDILRDKVDKSTVGNFPGEVMLPTVLFTRRKKGSPPNTARYLPPDFNPFPRKVSKIEMILKSPPSPVKRGRPPKKPAESAIKNKELTSPPKKSKKEGVSSNKVGQSSKMKQTKLSFKPKVGGPVSSTPIEAGTSRRRSDRLLKVSSVFYEEEDEEFEDHGAIKMAPLEEEEEDPPSPVSPSPVPPSPPSSPPSSPPPLPPPVESSRKRANGSNNNDNKTDSSTQLKRIKRKRKT